MWQKIENWISEYCFGILSLLLGFIEREHPVVAIGLPLLVTAAVQLFLPRWVSVALAVLVWLPAAVAMTSLLANCWMQIRPRRDFK